MSCRYRGRRPHSVERGPSRSPGSADHDDLPETYPGQPGEEVIRWLDQPDPIPPPAAGVVGELLEWEALSTRLTPADNFFTVKHYNLPSIDPVSWRLGINGLVAHERVLSLDELMSRPRQDVEFTLECSGNTGLPFFIGGIGNAVWGGAALGAVAAARSTARRCYRGGVLGHRFGHGGDPRQQRRHQCGEHRCRRA